MCISSVGLLPLWSGGSLTIFPVPLGVGKLALNRENFLHYIRYRHRCLLAYWASIWREGMSVFLYICTFFRD